MKIIADLLRAVFGSLYPPGMDEDPTKWRFTVFSVLSILTLAFTFHAASAGGHLSSFGFSGYSTRDQTNLVLYAIYAPQVRAKVAERCAAQPGTREREQINLELGRILREYRDATGKDFSPIPGCDEV